MTRPAEIQVSSYHFWIPIPISIPIWSYPSPVRSFAIPSCTQTTWQCWNFNCNLHFRLYTLQPTNRFHSMTITINWKGREPLMESKLTVLDSIRSGPLHWAKKNYKLLYFIWHYIDILNKLNIGYLHQYFNNFFLNFKLVFSLSVFPVESRLTLGTPSLCHCNYCYSNWVRSAFVFHIVCITRKTRFSGKIKLFILLNN